MSGTASAPGSSGNLGPGFDVIALALDVRCRVTATPQEEWRIVEDGTSYEPAATDRVVRAVDAAVGRPMQLTIANSIPRARGLGSSAAVMTASVAAAVRAMGAEPVADEVFRIVCEIEGHGDNAAAAVHGGLVVVAGESIRRLELSSELAVIVGIPNQHGKTAEARAALSHEIGRAVASRTLARLVFLVEGLRSGDADILASAAGDELHEEPRRDLSPVTFALMDAARGAGAAHAAWSGAGPAAITFVPLPEVDLVTRAMGEVLADEGEVRRFRPADSGLR